tara:strand:- start:1222 stop:2496 length:1275 start_codon:yes stop_codon:yes gene_type:complete
MLKTIAIIDANNFYASCEQILDPSLLGKPLVVLSNNDGCVISRSPEARKLGIKMGSPYFINYLKLKRLNVKVRSSNYELYVDISYRLMSLLKKSFDKIEIYSIDEAFIEISYPINREEIKWAYKIRAEIYKNIGITVSIGIGRTKVEAKIANFLAKTIKINSGIFDMVESNKKDQLLEDIEIENVWGVGKRLAEWSRTRGIKNARELRDYPSYQLKKKFGINGIRLQMELNGKICNPVELRTSRKKQIMVSRSFGRKVTKLKEIKESISTHITLACYKLRLQKDLALNITIFLYARSFENKFYINKASQKLEVPCNDTRIIIRIAMTLVEKIFDPQYSFIKSGVIISKLESIKFKQKKIFKSYHENLNEKELRLTKVIDFINDKYKKDTIKWASCGLKVRWKAKHELLGKTSTTNIKKIPIVFA